MSVLPTNKWPTVYRNKTPVKLLVGDTGKPKVCFFGNAADFRYFSSKILYLDEVQEDQ